LLVPSWYFFHHSHSIFSSCFLFFSLFQGLLQESPQEDTPAAPSQKRTTAANTARGVMKKVKKSKSSSYSSGGALSPDEMKILKDTFDAFDEDK
jgi:hypothetical protein